RLAKLGAELLERELPRYLDRKLVRRPQDVREVTLAPKLDPRKGELDPSRPAEELSRVVRAFAPDPGAFVTFRGQRIRVLRATAAEFAELTDLPKQLREALAASFSWTSVDPVREDASADGETRKALLRLADGHHIETVLMPHHGARNAVCVSTQAGCPMACAFCATGEMGLVRNLTAGEIVDQVRHWQRELAQRGERVSHVVFMGMGEPFN